MCVKVTWTVLSFEQLELSYQGGYQFASSQTLAANCDDVLRKWVVLIISCESQSIILEGLSSGLHHRLHFLWGWKSNFEDVFWTFHLKKKQEKKSFFTVNLFFYFSGTYLAERFQNFDVAGLQFFFLHWNCCNFTTLIMFKALKFVCVIEKSNLNAIFLPNLIFSALVIFIKLGKPLNIDSCWKSLHFAQFKLKKNRKKLIRTYSCRWQFLIKSLNYCQRQLTALPMLKKVEMFCNFLEHIIKNSIMLSKWKNPLWHMPTDPRNRQWQLLIRPDCILPPT